MTRPVIVRRLPLLLLLLLLLPALLAGGSASAQVTEGTASVRLLGQTNIVNTADLEFGAIAVEPAGGMAVLSPARIGGEPRQVTGDVTLMPGPASAATYDLRGRGNRWISVDVPAGDVTLTLWGGTATLTLSDFTTAPALKGKKERLKLDKLGQATLRVGGTLRLPGNIPDGSYRGTFDVTIDGY